mmetsp:Transcript_79970/g.214004  ORF Transcript_79970/g.214004 Transcript_79970/m.214004 type:complete len:100 (+) Transcript_79970:228-527(+)
MVRSRRFGILAGPPEQQCWTHLLDGKFKGTRPGNRYRGFLDNAQTNGMCFSLLFSERNVPAGEQIVMPASLDSVSDLIAFFLSDCCCDSEHGGSDINAN